MKTIASCVEDLVATQSFLEEGLSTGIINFSALAKHLVPQISEILKKPVKEGAIMMALRRYNSPLNTSNTIKLKQTLKQLGAITLRSNLIDFTFQNSKSLIHNHLKVLERIGTNQHIFYVFTRGVFESNLIISSSEKQHIVDSFKAETQIGFQENLSAISISLPQNNSKISGLYYHIFKRLTWHGVTLYEVISTTNEFTVLVEDHLVDNAFSVINNLKH